MINGFHSKFEIFCFVYLYTKKKLRRKFVENPTKIEVDKLKSEKSESFVVVAQNDL